jgi:hypothetical protein
MNFCWMKDGSHSYLLKGFEPTCNLQGIFSEGNWDKASGRKF